MDIGTRTGGTSLHKVYPFFTEAKHCANKTRDHPTVIPIPPILAEFQQKPEQLDFWLFWAKFLGESSSNFFWENCNFAGFG
jgi:hypothetical protein